MMRAMNDVRIGCRIQTGPDKKYWKNFRALEIDPRVVSTIRSSTARRWRSEAPEDAMFVPVAPMEVTRFDAAGLEVWKRVAELAGILASPTIVLRTPASFRPTSTNRSRLRSFVAEHRPDGVELAWWADGLWESQPDDRDALCAEVGITPVVDPLGGDDEDEGPPEGERIYWRLMGRKGLAPRYTDYELETLLDLVAERRVGYVFFSAPTMLPDARRFAGLKRMIDLEDMDDADG